MKRKMLLAFVSLLAGLMVAILFQSNQKPEIRDTRDLWEIRTDLRSEQLRQQNLYEQIREAESVLSQYESEPNSEKVETVKESVELLKEKVGLTEKTRRGLIVTIQPIFQDFEFRQPQIYPSIPPDLLSRLFNEFKLYGATDIAIGNERVISISPVRSVGGYTYVNNRPLPPLPIKLKVLAEDVEKLMDYMKVSRVNDYFAIENMELLFSIEEEVTLPSYDQPIEFNKFDFEIEETGES